ncbi:hypothetical protein V3C99_002362 [Haemonchus contortus]
MSTDERLEISLEGEEPLCSTSELLDGSQEADLKINNYIEGAPDETVIKELVQDVIEQQVEYLKGSVEPTDESASVAAIAPAAFDDEVDNDTNHLVESPPSSPVVAAMVDGLAPDHTQTQENIIAEEPIGYSPTTTSLKKDLTPSLTAEEKQSVDDHNGIDVEDDKKARPIPIEDAVTVEQEPVDYQKAEQRHIENDPLAVELLEELNVSVEPTVAESEPLKQGIPMEHEPYLISPKNGIPSKLDDEHLDTGPKPSERLKSAESREDEEFREAERRAELELDSELVIHDNEATPAAKENEVKLLFL